MQSSKIHAPVLVHFMSGEAEMQAGTRRCLIRRLLLMKVSSSMGALKPYSMSDSLSVQDVTMIIDTCRNSKESRAVRSSTVPFLWYLSCVSLSSDSLWQATKRIAKPFDSLKITSLSTLIPRLSSSESFFSGKIKHPLQTQVTKSGKTDILRSHLSCRCCYIQHARTMGKWAVTSASLFYNI